LASRYLSLAMSFSLRSEARFIFGASRFFSFVLGDASFFFGLASRYLSLAMSPVF
jgi:hypothetical protein